MERKIYSNLLLVASLTLILATVVLSYLFYDYYLYSMELSLKDMADLYLKGSLESNEDVYNNDLLIRVMDKAGSYTKKDHHIYYEKIDGDRLIVLEKPVDSPIHILASSGLIIISLLIFLILFLHNISVYLTRQLMEPIKKATDSMESIWSERQVDYNSTYPELVPFISNMNLYREHTNYYVSKLKENMEYRREFTANVSHELKTPLTSINGYAELISSGMAAEEDIPKLAQVIEEEGRRLLNLIDSIIDLSRLESKVMDIDFEEVDIYKIAQDIKKTMAPRIRQKNISLDLSGESTIIRANLRMMQDLFFNLIDNSIKYNNHGGSIHIAIYNCASKSCIDIQDTGIGISQSDLEHIFERFYIVDKSRTGKFKGTGLGLSIVKNIVKIHNGSIKIDSNLGEGTKIHISI